MASCFCTGACKKTGQCPSAKNDFGTFLSTMNTPTPVSYQKLGRKWIKVPLSLSPQPELSKQDLDSPRGYRHVGMDHF